MENSSSGSDLTCKNGPRFQLRERERRTPLTQSYKTGISDRQLSRSPNPLHRPSFQHHIPSAMSEIQSIAILGATGRLGTQLLAALAKHPRHKSLDIRVLTRPSPWPTEVDPSLRVSVYPIQYGTRDTHQALQRALYGVDVVISTVGDDSGLTCKDVRSIAELPGFRAQDVVAKAAKTAGVKLFIPSSVFPLRGDPFYGLADA